MTKKLIVDADDFGLTKGINQGIFEAIEKGVVSSVNVMTNMSYPDEISKVIKNFPFVSVGIHFNLTTGKPLMPVDKVRSLIKENGEFLDPKNFKRKYWRGEIKTSEIEKELDFQVMRLLSLNVKPTHFNSHQIKLLYPGIFSVVIKVTKKWGINKMRCYNRLIIGKNPKLIYYLSRPRRIFTHFYEKLLTSYANKKGIKTANRLIDFGLDLKNEAKLDNWLLMINNLPQGINEIRVHPGYIEEELIKFSVYFKEREKELQILTNPILKQAIKENKIELISFKEF